MNIAAVDDNAIIQQLLRITLSLEEDFKGEVFSDGHQLTHYASEHTIHMFIIDWFMSPYHGADLLRDLRADPNYAHTPIIILSGDDDPIIKAQAKDLGANGWMVKPFQPQQLIRVIKKLTNLSN